MDQSVHDNIHVVWHDTTNFLSSGIDEGIFYQLGINTNYITQTVTSTETSTETSIETSTQTETIPDTQTSTRPSDTPIPLIPVIMV